MLNRGFIKCDDENEQIALVAIMTISGRNKCRLGRYKANNPARICIIHDNFHKGMLFMKMSLK